MGEWFVCIILLQVRVDLAEVVSSAHYANASTFIIWFDDNESGYFSMMLFPLMLGCCRFDEGC